MNSSVSQIKELAVPILKRHNLAAAYLFGSAAAGRLVPASDIDIAVAFASGISLYKRFSARLRLMRQLSRAYGRKADVVVLNDITSVFFKYVIITEGKLLYQQSEAERLELERRIYSEYFDFQPFLEDYNRHYVQSRS